MELRLLPMNPILRRSTVPVVFLMMSGTALAQQAVPPPAESILVTGTRGSSDYSEEETDVFGFAPVKALEVPQSVQILNRAFIDDSGALSIGELMQNVPGASNALARTVPFGTGSLLVRGQDVAIFRDGLRDIDFSDIDQSALTNVERIDVLKGPAGLIYGTGLVAPSDLVAAWCRLGVCAWRIGVRRIQHRLQREQRHRGGQQPDR